MQTNAELSRLIVWICAWFPIWRAVTGRQIHPNRTSVLFARQANSAANATETNFMLQNVAQYQADALW